MHNAHCIYYLISSFIFTLHKPEDDCKVENICLGFSEKLAFMLAPLEDVTFIQYSKKDKINFSHFKAR